MFCLLLFSFAFPTVAADASFKTVKPNGLQRQLRLRFQFGTASDSKRLDIRLLPASDGRRYESFSTPLYSCSASQLTLSRTIMCALSYLAWSSRSLAPASASTVDDVLRGRLAYIRSVLARGLAIVCSVARKVT